MTTYDELFQIVVDRHLDLLKLDTLKFRRETAPDILQRYDEEVERLYALRREVFRELLTENTTALQAHTTSLSKINDELETTIGDVTKIAETLSNLVKFIQVVGEIASLVSSVAAAPSPAPLIAAAMRAKSAASSERRAHVRAESDQMQPESHLEEKAPLFLIEEVLYGVELTPEKLVITVATGGCTDGGDFRFDVNKTASPYIVTVYRIVSDDCKGAFKPIQVPYSREELGLDGAVEFILRNKIGNTSQHRLNI